jgi:RNA polymerase I-specific transcription initiation factor RRN3
MVEKLDAVLNLVFDHFHRTHSLATAKSVRSNSPAPANNFAFPQLSLTPEAGRSIRQAQFSTLLNIFDRLILNTFKSRYTQFLVFWYSSLDPEFTDRFLGLLLSKSLFEIDQPMTTRAAATSYVAGLVSRAHFVDKTHTRRVVGLLCQCLSGQLDGFGTLSISQHAIFYAVAQAVFLIFCFRWRDLVEQDEEDDADTNPSRIPGGKKWLPELDVMKRVILSPLNPLKVRHLLILKFEQKTHVWRTDVFC